VRYNLNPIYPSKTQGLSQSKLDSETYKEMYSDKLKRLSLFDVDIKNGKERLKCRSVGALLVRKILNIEE
jgi:hypothetical protein